ncbi:deoxyribonuclease gamma-like [Eretmochelys imbricata]
MHPLALLLLGLRLAGAGFKICAFNAHGFGEAKSGDTWVMGALVQILVRCDIAAVQEVRDMKGDAMQALLRELNRYWASQAPGYAQLGSRRLGRGTYKEQIVFLYRREREWTAPWGARHPGQFHRSSHTLGVKGNRTQVTGFPSCSLPPQNVMVLGDLNAGGAYVPHNAWGSIRLRWDPRFHWLIGDGVNTTVRARTHCAYDRIVVQGDELLRAVVPGSAKPYNFARSLGLSEEEALQVSDHYPVEVNLYLAGQAPQEL